MGDLATLCAAVDWDQITRRSVERIRAELPAYLTIPVEEHTEAVARQQRNQLEALANGREVAGQALADAASLARSRAQQAIDIEVLLGAYHLGDQVLWNALVEAADDATTALLPRAAELLFASLHLLSTALTAAHADASQALQTRRITAAHRMVELLLAERTGAETETHARALGLDPEGEFVAAVLAEPRHAAVPGSLLHALEATGGTFAIGQGPDGAVIICQGIALGTIAQVLAEHGAGFAGVGLSRAGLAGGARSLGDARLAVSATFGTASTVVRFDHAWADACVLAERTRLGEVISPIVEITRKYPHLADSVRAFAEADMQLARAAQALHLHPNSLSYRLKRWASLTGWDPRTFDGLRRSLLAIAAA